MAPPLGNTGRHPANGARRIMVLGWVTLMNHASRLSPRDDLRRGVRGVRP